MKGPLRHENITHLESHENYTLIYFHDGHTELYSYTLKVFEEKFHHTTDFRRIHRKYLVNKNYVKDSQNCSVLLKNGTELPIARRRR